MLWLRFLLTARIATLCDKVLSVICGSLVVFSESSVFLHQLTDRHDITEKLLKVALNTITPNQTNQPSVV